MKLEFHMVTEGLKKHGLEEHRRYAASLELSKLICPSSQRVRILDENYLALLNVSLGENLEIVANDVPIRIKIPANAPPIPWDW